MDPEAIHAKFGGDYVADERTFQMGIDARFTSAIARRFRGRRVLETCGGAGFTTIPLARVADRVTSVDIEPAHQQQARINLTRAGLPDRVTLVCGDILDEHLWARLPAFESAFLDPDWAITGPGHVHRFKHSATRPPADALLQRVLRATPDAALILPPEVDLGECAGLPPHESQRLYLKDRHELYCLYFGELKETLGESELRM